MECPQFLFGCRVILKDNLCCKVKLVNRTWKERLFSLPWKPFKKRKPIQIPSDEIIYYPNGSLLVMHSETWEKIAKWTEGEIAATYFNSKK